LKINKKWPDAISGTTQDQHQAKKIEKKRLCLIYVHNEWLISIHPTRTLQQT
jgi:hypothetical protein